MTAVLALERAAAALGGGEAQAAVDELEAQRTTLRPVERARSLWREAHQRLEEERRRRGREALGSARAALDQGRTAEARRLLDNLPRADLADRDRARAEDLGSEIGSAEALERLARQVRERRAAGDLAGALTRARVLARRTRDRCGSAPRSPGEGDPAERWSRRLAELQGLLRTAWELEVVTEEVPVEEAPPPSHWREKSVVWLDGEGRELVLANAWDRWLFLSLVDVRRSRVTARVSLKTPRPLEPPLHTRRHGSRLWITGRGGDMVELERDGWDILGYYPLDELVTGGRSLDGVVPLPGGPWVWMHVKGEGGGDVTWVADRAEHRVVHRLTDGLTSFVPILGGAEPRVLRSGPRLAARLFTVAGEPASSESLVRGFVADADRGPDGRGLLLLAHRDPGPVAGADAGGESEDKGRELVRFVESPPGGTLVRSAALELPEVNPFGFPAVVTAPELGRTFVLIYTNDHHSELLVFSEPSADPSDRLQPVFRTRCPGQATLVHDLGVRRIAAMTFVGGDVQLRFLDSDEPTLAGMGKKRSPKGWPYPRPTIFANVCDQPTGAVDAAVGELAGELQGRDAKALRTHLVRTEIRATASADDIVLVALALLRLEHRDKVYGVRQTVEELARRLARKHPRHAGVQLLLADFEAREERWEEVGRLLGGASAAGLDAGRACHFHHLEGLAHFHAGRLDEAYEAFCRGVDHSEGKCGLEPLRDLTQPMESPPREDEWAPDQPLVRRLAGALRAADFALTAGDPETARRALDRQDVRWEVDLQLTARRASAYLEATAATAVERFHERAALSFYLHVRQQDQYMRRNLFLPGLHWDEERLAAVEAQARARLEKLGEP